MPILCIDVEVPLCGLQEGVHHVQIPLSVARDGRARGAAAAATARGSWVVATVCGGCVSRGREARGRHAPQRGATPHSTLPWPAGLTPTKVPTSPSGRINEVGGGTLWPPKARLSAATTLATGLRVTWAGGEQAPTDAPLNVMGSRPASSDRAPYGVPLRVRSLPPI